MWPWPPSKPTGLKSDVRKSEESGSLKNTKKSPASEELHEPSILGIQGSQSRTDIRKSNPNQKPQPRPFLT